MRRALVPLVILCMAPGPCELPMPPQGGAAGMGMPAADGGVPGTGAPLRDVTFFAVPAGEFVGATIDGVQVRLGPYRSPAPTALVQDRFGAGNDLVPSCATVGFAPPELHRGASVVYSDEPADLVITVYDALGAILGMFSTRDNRRNAQPAGMYLRQPLQVVDPQRAIALIEIASCDGLIHEVVFQ